LPTRSRTPASPGLGTVEKITGTEPTHYYPKLFGRTGVVYFQDYWKRTTDSGRPTGDHIDVWNGYRSSAKWLLEWFSWLGYYWNYANAGRDLVLGSEVSGAAATAREEVGCATSLPWSLPSSLPASLPSS
jgi:Type VI secretion system (T6SS), amidase effector protein 4